MAKRKTPGKRGNTRGASRGKKALLAFLFTALAGLGVTGVQYYRDPESLRAPFGGATTAVEPGAGIAPTATPARRGETHQLETIIARVVRVVDGDTAIVTYGGQEERVRFLHVDTPESVHPDKSKNTPEGKAAASFTRRELEAAQVRLEYDAKDPMDNNGRRLAYVFLEGTNFNVRLVREGWSKYYTKYGKSRWYDAEFRAAEEEARAAERGLWAKH